MKAGGKQVKAGLEAVRSQFLMGFPWPESGRGYHGLNIHEEITGYI